MDFPRPRDYHGIMNGTRQRGSGQRFVRGLLVGVVGLASVLVSVWRWAANGMAVPWFVWLLCVALVALSCCEVWASWRRDSPAKTRALIACFAIELACVVLLAVAVLARWLSGIPTGGLVPVLVAMLAAAAFLIWTIADLRWMLR